LTLWDVTRKLKLRTLKGPKGPISFVSFLGHSTKALAASGKALYLYQLPQGNLVRRVEAYRGVIYVTALSPSRKFALTLGTDDGEHATLKLWKVSSGILLKAINGGDASTAYLAVSSDGRWALTAGNQIDQGSKTQLWNLRNGKLSKMLPGENGWGGPVAFSLDGKFALLTMTKNAQGQPTASHFVLAKRSRWKAMQVLEGWPGVNPAFVGKGKQVVAYLSIHQVNFWDVKTGKVINTVTVYPGDRPWLKKPGAAPSAAIVHACGFSAKARFLAIVAGDWFVNQDSKVVVKIWSLANKRLVCTWQDPTGS
jgi:WD40 repeat protein